MSLSQYLEKDRERLQNRLAAAHNRNEAVTILEEEVSRLLLLFNEKQHSDETSESAAAYIQILKSAVSLVDNDGEIRVFEREGKKKKFQWVFWVFAGALLMTGGGIAITVVADSLKPVLLAVMAAGGLFLLIGGIRIGKNKAPKAAEKERHIEVGLDIKGIFHDLLAAANVADHLLEEKERERASAKSLPDLKAESGLPKDEMKLLSGLLENAYGLREEPGYDDMISDIKFYLHDHGIELQDYTPEKAAWFSRIPARKEGTIRPALVKNGVLIEKGLAAGKGE